MRNLAVRVLLILFLCALARAANAHGPYTGMETTDGFLCCNDHECAPYPAEKVQEVPGGYLLEDGVFVPLSRVKASFDHQFHRCDWQEQKARCFLAPLSM